MILNILFWLQVALCIHGILHLQIQQIADEKILEKKSRSSKKQHLKLPHTSIYLDSIFIVFTTVYIAFSLYLQLFT